MIILFIQFKHGLPKKADAELIKYGKIMRRPIFVFLISAEWKELLTYVFLHLKV